MSSEARDRLRQISLFDEIRDHEESMSHLEAITRLAQVPAGTTIIKEGEVGSEMYIVFRGQVEIKKQTRAGDDYTVVRLDATQNVFFGELALVDDDKRSATVLATEDSEFLVITKKDFARLGDTHPEIALPVTRAIARILAGRLRKTTVDMLTIFDALVSEIQQ
jgi:CRP/FNR family transcriptional regulator, cyclic AMP receptor protein